MYTVTVRYRNGGEDEFRAKNVSFSPQDLETGGDQLKEFTYTTPSRATTRAASRRTERKQLASSKVSMSVLPRESHYVPHGEEERCRNDKRILMCRYHPRIVTRYADR